jgi:hypothetical protein
MAAWGPTVAREPEEQQDCGGVAKVNPSYKGFEGFFLFVFLPFL